MWEPGYVARQKRLPRPGGYARGPWGPKVIGGPESLARQFPAYWGQPRGHHWILGHVQLVAHVVGWLLPAPGPREAHLGITERRGNYQEAGGDTCQFGSGTERHVGLP